MDPVRLEICVDDLTGARVAAAAGADRLELCSELAVGGLSPGAGLLERVIGTVDLPVVVLVRPRAGDFVASPDELEVMLADVTAARRAGAAGVAVGVLDPQGRIDRPALARLREAARDLELCVHRAFDQSPDLHDALEVLVQEGVDRVLTSGGRPDVVQGLTDLSDLVRQAGPRLVVMPGGGLTPANAARVASATGAREVHGSARGPVEGAPRPCPVPLGPLDGVPRQQTRGEVVAALRAALVEARQPPT